MELKSKKTDLKLIGKEFPNISSMTSREFHTDAHARADLVASHLKDKVTMKIFEEVIRFNRHLFKDKIVLVLNAGIDLCFPLWAVKHGAEHVYAVDSSCAVDYIKVAVEGNNMCDKVSIVRGRVQDIELPVDKVDIILSNWMGYALLIEDKIRSVIYARDRWLKPHGVILPDCADLLIAGVQNSKNKNQRIDWWRDVQSFNMNAIRKTAVTEPTFQKIDPNEILTMPVRVWTINMKKITAKELRFQTTFYMEITQGGSLEGLLAYFDVRFSRSHVPVRFSTSPWAPYTKWLQTIFYFDDPLSVNVGERYHGGIRMNHCFHKDGSFATNTYLELYSGLRSNLSLIFNRSWLCKWVYADHINGAEYLISNRTSSSPTPSASTLAQNNSPDDTNFNKNSTSDFDEKSVNDKKLSLKENTKTSPQSLNDKDQKTLNVFLSKQPQKPVVGQQLEMPLNKTVHDWSFETMQRELQSTMKVKLTSKSSRNSKTKDRLFKQAIGDLKKTDFPPLTESVDKSHSQAMLNAIKKVTPNTSAFNITNSTNSTFRSAKKSKQRYCSTDASMSSNNLPIKDLKGTKAKAEKVKKSMPKGQVLNVPNTAKQASVNGRIAETIAAATKQKPKQKRKYHKTSS